MKLKSKKIISMFLAMLMLFSVLPAGIMTSSAAGGVKVKLDSIISNYPSGSSWTGSFDTGSECYGFAKMVIYKIFGSYNGRYRSWLYDGTSTSGMNTVGSITNFSSSNVKNLVSNAKCGDVLQFNTPNQHSMIIYSVSSSNFRVYDCNSDMKCGVKLRTINFGDWSSKNSTKLTLLRSNNYSAIDGSENELAAPKNLKVTAVGEKLKVTWDSVSGANCYDVIVTDPSGSQNWWHASSNDKYIPITSLGTYKIEVQSLYRPNGSSTGQTVGKHSNVVSHTVNLLGPTNVKIELKGTRFKVSWNSVTGANCYDVIVTDPDGITNWYHSSCNEKYIAVDKPGTYKFDIQSLYRANGSTSGQIVGAHSGNITYELELMVPQNVRYDNVDGKFNLYWDSVAGATCYDVVITKPDGETEWLHSHENYKSIDKFEYGKYSFWIQGIYRKNCPDKNGQIGGAHTSNFVFDYQAPVEHNHRWDKGVIVTAANCTQTGEKLYTCSDCSATRTEVVEKTTHNIVIDENVEPTCLINGYTQGSHCSVCGLVIEAQNVIGATGHKFSKEEEFCLNNCGVKNPDYVEHIHNWDNGVTVKRVSCTENGYIVFTCEGCNESYTEIIYTNGHYYTESITDPTCIENGYTTHICINCGDTYSSDFVQSTGHSFASHEKYCTYGCGTENPNYSENHTHSWNSGVITKPENCLIAGVKTYTCTLCGEMKNEIILATGHSYETAIVDPTCTENGYTKYLCTNCGDTYNSDYIFATGHKYDNGKVTKQATCTANGVKTYTCTVCKATKTSAIKALGHNYTTKVVKPTYTSEGYTLHTCSRCKKSYKDKKTKKLVLKNASLTKLTAGKKAFTVKWKKQETQTTGYQIQYSTDKKFKKNNKTVTVSKNKTTSKKITKLKAKKKYYVRIRTYKTVKVNGKSTKIYSSWSKAKSVTTKK